MANIWAEYDKTIDKERLAKDIEEADKNGGRREVPYDTYEVVVKKLELIKSKKGNPMVVCRMKIVEGEYKNSLISMYQVVTQGLHFHVANDFMRALVSEVLEDKKPDIFWESYEQYNDVVLEVWEAIDNKFEYLVEYKASVKNPQYSDFVIKEVYVLED